MSLNSMPGLTPAHTVVTVGAVSTAVLAAKTSRTGALFINDSDEIIYLNLGGAAAANTGIRLNAAGGSYEMGYAQGNLFTGAINGICASGNKKLLVTEFVSAA